MKLPDVSVIIPVYNAEQYILYLLKDLNNQVYKKAEFILINDGSTDRSLQVMKDYIERIHDNRFRIINQPNSGVSTARNNGLDHSCGKYIIFVDSDDRISPLFIKKYVSQIVNNSSDIEVFSALKVDDRRKLKETGKINYTPIASQEILSVAQYIKYFSNLQAWGYPFCYIFKRTLWNNIRFDPHIKYQEDVLAFFEIWAKNPNIKIHVNAEAYYYYVIRKDSALHTMTSKDAWQFVEVDDKVLKLIKKQPSLARCYDYLLALKVSSLMIVIATSCLENDNEYYWKARSEFIKLYGQAKYNSRKIWLRRKLQAVVIYFNLKFAIKKLYTHLYSN